MKARKTWRCGNCGGRRERRPGICYDCAVDKRTQDQRHRDAELLVPVYGSAPAFVSRDRERGRTDEGEGIASHYRGAYFPLCELCGKRRPIDGIVCADCAPRVAPAPEAAMRDPDVSDVARVLREMGRL